VPELPEAVGRGECWYVGIGKRGRGGAVSVAVGAERGKNGCGGVPALDWGVGLGKARLTLVAAAAVGFFGVPVVTQAKR
jgi:hypothetical protein